MKVIILFFTLTLFGIAYSEPEDIIEKNIEEILQDGSEKTEESVEFLELLQELKANPININAASVRDLQILYFLSNEQIEAIIRYRNDYGHINGIYELYYIPFFNEKIASAIEPYIYFGNEDEAKWTLGTALKKGKHSAFFRYGQVLMPSEAYQYGGSPAALLVKYSLKFSDNLRAGFAFEKDAGEKGIDFFSGYIDFGNGSFGNNTKILKQWLVGTYKASFGYGLGMGGGGMFNSISNPDISVRPAQGIRPYGSGGETGYFSGTAIVLAPAPRTEISLFYANNLLDASYSEISDTSADEEHTEVFDISSSSGYHRKVSEIEKRKTLRRQMAGFAVEHFFKKFRIGGLVNYTCFDDLTEEKIRLYNKYNALFSSLLQSSIYYQWRLYGKMNFFGEISLALKSIPSFAVFQGFQYNASEIFKIIFYYRYYPRSYSSYYASAPGRNSNNTNENGFNFQASLAIYKSWKLIFTTDHYSREWFSYPSKYPSNGHDYKIETGNYGKRLTFYTLYRYRNEDNLNTHRLRFHFAYNTMDRWSFATRIELNNFSKGVLTYQEIKYSFSYMPLKLSARIALFDTKGYDYRIYAFEQDVLHGFSAPALYGRGTRLYALVAYKPLRWLSVWLRYAHTLMDDRYSYGPKNEFTEGTYRPEIKVQVRLTL